MAKCPPGVIYFENLTCIYVIIAFFTVIYFMYIKNSSLDNIGGMLSNLGGVVDGK
jgi:hypothetical protein